MGPDDHLVARTHAAGAQHQGERSRPEATPDALVDLAIARELRFESLDLFAEDERVVAQNA
jgi:hypothetical protein